MHPVIAKWVYQVASKVRGEATFRYKKLYEASQWIPAEEAEINRTLAGKALINYLTTAIPYYAEIERATLAELPVITKKELVTHSKQFRPAILPRKVTIKTTGGSTGQPVTVYKDAEAMAREQGATMRAYTWAGLSPGDKQYRMWGTATRTGARLKSNLRDRLLNRRRFSAFNYSDEDFFNLYKDFVRFRPAYIYGYVSIIKDFALYLQSVGKTLPSGVLKCVITTSEILTEGDRKIIAAAYGSRVFNEYGCGEVGTIAHECEKGSMHINTENLIIEILDEQNKPTSGDGRIVLTELHNRAQPLVRYDVGDYGRLSDRGCDCGRPLPILKNIHGRAYDVIFGPNGQKYHPEFFIYIMEALNHDRNLVNQFQVVQDSRRLIVYLVCIPEHVDFSKDYIRRGLVQEFGDYFEIVFEVVDAIAREPSGKMRVVKRLQPVELLD